LGKLHRNSQTLGEPDKLAMDKKPSSLSSPIVSDKEQSIISNLLVCLKAIFDESLL